MQPHVVRPGGGCLLLLEPESLHDLIGPVNQVCTMAELIRKKYGDSLEGEADMLLGYLEASAGRLRQLMAGLRDYTRIVGNAAPYRSCDGNALLAVALAALQPAVDESGAVVTHDPLPEMYCDANQITHTLACLIENAIKFRSDDRPQIHICAGMLHGRWRFRVRDNGIGIDPARQERIFGVFQRVSGEDRPGAGMGLAIARQIIQRHGGRIWVESQLGHGSTFFFELPGIQEGTEPSRVEGVLAPA